MHACPLTLYAVTLKIALKPLGLKANQLSCPFQLPQACDVRMRNYMNIHAFARNRLPLAGIVIICKPQSGARHALAQSKQRCMLSPWRSSPLTRNIIICVSQSCAIRRKRAASKPHATACHRAIRLQRLSRRTARMLFTCPPPVPPARADQPRTRRAARDCISSRPDGTSGICACRRARSAVHAPRPPSARAPQAP